MTDSRICIALDFQNKAEVKEFLEKFKSTANMYFSI